MKEDDARTIVRATLQELGVDITDPIEVQKDFAFVRRQRVVSEKIGMGVRLAAIGIFVSGAMGALWIGIKAAFQQPVP